MLRAGGNRGHEWPCSPKADTGVGQWRQEDRNRTGDRRGESVDETCYASATSEYVDIIFNFTMIALTLTRYL